MWITHSFVGTSPNDVRCLFFVLYEDYIQAQSKLAQELDRELERFARNLEDSGAVVKPFTGDIDTTRENVLEKNWTEDQEREIVKTPSILMIDIGFDDFDPQEHRWVLLHLGGKMRDTKAGSEKFKDMLEQISSAVKNLDSDSFEVAHEVQNKVTSTDAAKIFEAKPGVFGFSVDLIEAGDALKTLYRRHQNR